MSRRFRFGLFELDPATGVLHREGVPVRLQPQPGRVLTILITRAGEVVTRDVLRQEIWHDGTFVDFERGLNFCVAQIRAALGDSAESPRFIETLPRRGYRFIAPVSQQGAGIVNSEQRLRPERGAESPRESERGWGPASVDKCQPNAGNEQRARLSFPRLVPSVVSIVLTALTVALVTTAWQVGSGDRRVRIAVVPFDNETGMEELDRIARGVADATVARLSTPQRVAMFSVIGNAAELHQPRAFRDLKRIGAALGADYIVLAQMKRDDTGVRLIAHLIRVRDQAHVWANTYDRADMVRDGLPGRLSLAEQAEIAEAIASEVANALVPSPSHRV